MNTNILQYSVVYQADMDGGYVASVPAMPGCHSQGDTLEETEKNITEAIELYLESLHAHGDEIPEEKKVLLGTIAVPQLF